MQFKVTVYVKPPVASMPDHNESTYYFATLAESDEFKKKARAAGFRVDIHTPVCSSYSVEQAMTSLLNNFVP